MKPRVVLIGPVLPYRGGIAQHTTMLHRALSARAELLTISFSRQYPAWLFPGESDKDPAYEGHEEAGVTYAIDSLNPLSWRDAAQSIIRFAPTGVILLWWTAYWTFCFRYIASAIKRENIPLVFFCHNLIEHEDALWKRVLAKWVLATTNHFVVHSQRGKEAILEYFPKASVLVYPHPIYDHFPQATEKLPRRAGLELLFFGFVRPYKGLEVLLDALALLRGKDIKLTIAGEFWSGLDSCMAKIESLGLHEMVELRPTYHSEAEIAELFVRSDAVVLPYLSATGCGVISIAYRYGKPVIATNVGGLPDVIQRDKTGVLVEANSAAALAGAIGSMSSERAASMRPDIRRFSAALTWDGLAKTVLDSLAQSR